MNVPSPKETNTKYQYNFLKGIDESKLAPKRRRELLRLLKGDNITESNLQEGTESIVDKSKKKIRNITDLKSEYILFLRKLLSERVDVKEWLSVSQQTERVSSMPNVLSDYINQLTNNDEKKTEDILKVVIEEFD